MYHDILYSVHLCKIMNYYIKQFIDLTQTHTYTHTYIHTYIHMYNTIIYIHIHTHIDTHLPFEYSISFLRPSVHRGHISTHFCVPVNRWSKYDILESHLQLLRELFVLIKELEVSDMPTELPFH